MYDSCIYTFMVDTDMDGTYLEWTDVTNGGVAIRYYDRDYDCQSSAAWKGAGQCPSWVVVFAGVKTAGGNFLFHVPHRNMDGSFVECEPVCQYGGFLGGRH